MNRIIKVLLIFLFTVITVHADKKSLYETVKGMPILHNGSNFVEDDGKIYLIGVGHSPIRGQDAQAKVNAIKEAQMFAHKAIMSFSYGTEVEIEETLKKTKVTTTIVIDGEVVSRNKKRTKEYIQSIRESGDGILVGLKKLGKWKENNKYFFAYYVLVPQ